MEFYFFCMWLLPSDISCMISGVSMRQFWKRATHSRIFKVLEGAVNIFRAPSRSFSSSFKTQKRVFNLRDHVRELSCGKLTCQENKKQYHLRTWHILVWISCIDKPSLHSEVLRCVPGCMWSPISTGVSVPYKIVMMYTHIQYRRMPRLFIYCLYAGQILWRRPF